MGEVAAVEVGKGQATAIATGGMLPVGADAVVMVEYTSLLDSRTIEVTRPVAPGDNTLKKGEDISESEVLFTAGWRLRPQDVGVLAALGIAGVSVFHRPKVAIISTGDEIVPLSARGLPPGKIRDINRYTLDAQIREAGYEVGCVQWVPDDLDSLAASCGENLTTHDVLILSGGSSVGVRDFTLRILDRFPGADLLVHGVAIRPGKPTILARLGAKLFWGLPGQPVSAMMIARAFVLPSLARLEGMREIRGISDNTRTAMLSRQLPSVHGRTDYIPVVLSRSERGILGATPVFGKSAMIGILARADGYVVIPEHVEGLDQGTEVEVFLLSG
jgi:molybdopterin molybdotransferase